MVVQESLTTFGMPFQKINIHSTSFAITCTFEMYPEVISGMILIFNKKYKKILKLEFMLKNTNLLKAWFTQFFSMSV